MSMLDDIRNFIANAISVTNAVKIISLPEDFFAQGRAFTMSHDYTFTSAQTRDFLVDPTAFVPPMSGQDRIVALVPSFAANQGPLLVKFYSEPTLTGNGTQQVVFNRDSTSLNAAQMKVYVDATSSAPGAGFSEILIPANAGGPVSVGQSITESLPFALDTNKKLLMRVVNENGNDTRVGIRFTWFEF